MAKVHLVMSQTVAPGDDPLRGLPMPVAEQPIIPGFHPDPSICLVGSDYYLVNSSFEYFPGVPIFRSVDLQTWTPLGHVLDRPGQLHVLDARPSRGIYAPTLRHHDGRFWMITTNVSDPPGQLLVTAVDPAGPWSEPVRVPEAHGIDPDLAWDEAGTCWLSWSGELPAGRRGIVQAALDTATGSLLSEPAVIWRGTGGQWPEGPHLYRRGSFWYLLIAEGGTERGHAVTVARSRKPGGPFEACPSNPVLTARGTDWPTQNTGHADLVQRGDDSWAVVFLGVRPRGSTPGWHVLGRETFAAEVEWDDDWPRVGAPIEGMASGLAVDTLEGPRLPHSWVSSSCLLSDVLSYRAGEWQVLAQGPEAFVGRRQDHFFTRTQAAVEPRTGDIGLEIRIDPLHRVSIRAEGQGVRATATIGGLEIVLGETAVPTPAVLELRTSPSQETIGAPWRGPDVIIAGVQEEGRFRELGRIDGRYLSSEVAGGFTGRMIGLIAERGQSVVRSFQYKGCDDAALLEVPICKYS